MFKCGCDKLTDLYIFCVCFSAAVVVVRFVNQPTRTCGFLFRACWFLLFRTHLHAHIIYVKSGFVTMLVDNLLQFVLGLVALRGVA